VSCASSPGRNSTECPFCCSSLGYPVTISGCLAPFCYCTYNNGSSNGSSSTSGSDSASAGSQLFSDGFGAGSGSNDDQGSVANCNETVGPLKNWPPVDLSTFKCRSDANWASCPWMIYVNISGSTPFASSKLGNPVRGVFCVCARRLDFFWMLLLSAGQFVH
jgi:hypothetical protein